MGTMLERLNAERADVISFIDRTVQEANKANDGKGRDLTASEKETMKNSKTRIAELDEQIVPLKEHEASRAASAEATKEFAPTQERGQYGGAPGTPQPVARTQAVKCDYKTRGQVIVDQIRAAGLDPSHYGQHEPDAEARGRLVAAGVTPPLATSEEIRAAKAAATQLAGQYNAQERVTQVSGDTPGIIPVPIVGAVMNDVDEARPFIDSLGAKPLDFAGETFKRPLITQHVAMGKQTTQATSTGLGSQKMIIGSVTFTKETWGGWLDVSRQDIDWTSPSAWDALLTDFTDQYGLTTENAAGDAFAAAVAAGNTPVEVLDPGASPAPLSAWVTAVYAAAALSYAGAGRMPDHIWMSLDLWGVLGPLIEAQVPTMNNDLGQVSLGDFQAGNLLKLPRTVVPSFPANTLIIGAKRWTEVYEERIGLLQAVNPSILGVQIAYGGYIAYNTIKPTAFTKVTNAVNEA